MMELRQTKWSRLALQLPLVILALVVLFNAQPAKMVRPNDFKKCGDSSFCRRLRRLSSYSEEQTRNNHGSPFESPYFIASKSTKYDSNTATLKATVKSALHSALQFDLQVLFYNDGTSRVKLDQGGQKHGGWKRYDEAAAWAIDQQPIPAEAGQVNVQEDNGQTTVTFGPNGENKLLLSHQPLKATYLRNGVPQVVLNERGLLHMEHYRPKPDPFPSANDDDAKKLVFQNRKRSFEEAGHASIRADQWSGFEQEDDGEWEESFSGRTDTKPKGPEALSLDIEFPGKTHVFGLPEHASPLNLRSTRGHTEEDFKEPYRLMNTDVFEYDSDSPMSLYGSVPIMHAQSADSAASVLWLSGSETWIDIDRSETNKVSKARAHFFSESGILDLWVFLKPTPGENLATFSQLTGRTPLPAYFSLGYHQCRWNYLTTDDVLNVNKRFSEDDIPVDVLWLDIEYAKNHWYGVWNEETFPKPERMLEGLDAEGRKLVIIIDPHFARKDEYFLYKEANSNDLFVKDADNKNSYEGWCWSGSASWTDNFNPKFWAWWKTIFSLAGKKIKANARNMHFWLDMNEPAIFNGPEITAPKDVRHHGGWEHRDVHNIYSVAYHNASYEAAKARETPNRRPFLLARGWWIGTWKAGPIWTGDNLGTWEHLAVAAPMILANNIGGMSFCGADVGGFFGNPAPDFLLRWYQAGIFHPFFRAHAHIDTKRREPYLLAEPHKSAVRELIKLRYQLLPVWYTAFKQSNHGGLPVLRPQYVMFPNDVNGFSIDDQYYIGDSGLLVKPAVKADAESVEVYLAEDQPYYHFFTKEVYFGSSSGKKVTVQSPLTSEVPLLMRGGSILPIRQRVRRSAELGWRDPFTLIVSVNKPASSGSDTVRASGRLYLDDGQTYDHEKGDFVWRQFDLHHDQSGKHVLKITDLRPTSSKTELATFTGQSAFAEAIADVRVERLIVLGLEKAPSAIHAIDSKTNERVPLQFTWQAGVSATSKGLKSSKKSSELIIKDPAVKIIGDWKIEFDV
ncbi:uncharacterized protein FA14DRAFT_24232 [Meira miltonrushii]|uniref:Glucosidase II subunit alpha n=1 Tax=Meira miltonrushii TaxID=1280837 RepID=A0A316VPA0_9BASI|nr:uncharacterized protein FA14DRAFT_24232 [Meira miltonrushii]PWN38233.1 hypothetical protein FA14DRAFT_24232 [Meira miltonrushii]